MIRKILVLISILLSLANGLVFARGGQNAPAAAAKESASVKTWPAVFKPSGTDAALYTANTEKYVREFQDWNAKQKGGVQMLLGYDSPLTVHLGFYYTPSLQDAINMELSKKYGESFESNRWTDVIHRLYNIDVKYDYIIPEADYDQRLRLDMAANTLPDVFVVRNHADLVQMAQAGVLADLTGLRNAYGSPTDEANWMADDGLLIDMSTIGGKLYGLPIPVPTTDFFSYLWLRKDWVEALKITPPKTLDDLTKVIEAFVNADFDRNGVKDTVGLTMEQDFYYSSRGIFNGCNAYPEVWENLNGVLSWGGVNPNNKKALAYLADLYKRGYIDHEFVRYTYNDKLRAVINGRAGVMYGGHWEVAAAAELHNLDPKAGWMAVPLPSLDGRPVRSPMKPAFRGWVVANAKYANPEVAYKLKGVVGFYLSDGNSEPAWWSVEGTGNAAGWLMMDMGGVSPMMNLNNYIQIKRALDTKDMSGVHGGALANYNALSLPGADGWSWNLMMGGGDWVPFIQLKDAYEGKRLFYDAFTGVPSTYMQQRWQAVRDQQAVAFTKIITGDLTVDAGFDEWLKTFNSMGGGQITNEVNAWYKSR